MNDLKDKIKEAEQALRLAAEMSEYYYKKPLIVCYSGGKDSDVLLDIAKKCLKPEQFEVVNSHTTVDAPETVYHIREVFKDLQTEGISTRIVYPKYKGKRTTMWRLIEDKQMPPTRFARYCCDILKENSTPNRFIALGVREDESKKRAGRDIFEANKKEFRPLSHTYAMFKIDQSGKEGAYECKFIQNCKKNKNSSVNPIYHFTEDDIWEYVKKYDLKMNPLYAKGYKRVGCVGCPLAGGKQQVKEFIDYPKYKENYIKAFDRMQKNNEKKGKENKYGMTSGEDWYRWWIGENPKQIRFDDLLKEDKHGKQ